MVEAYDVRPAAREQIISVGAKPVELDLDTGESEAAGGYAKAQGEDFLRRQRELMTAVIAEQDIIITTAAIPGAKSPILVTEDMVKAMKPGSVIVDLGRRARWQLRSNPAGEDQLSPMVSPFLGLRMCRLSWRITPRRCTAKICRRCLSLIIDE